MSGSLDLAVPLVSQTRPPRSHTNMRPSPANATPAAPSHDLPSGRCTEVSTNPAGSELAHGMALDAASSSTPSTDTPMDRIVFAMRALPSLWLALWLSSDVAKRRALLCSPQVDGTRCYQPLAEARAPASQAPFVIILLGIVVCQTCASSLPQL